MAGPPWPGPDHVHRVEVAGRDDPVQVRVDEVQAGGGAPVAEQPRLDVLGPQRLAQQRVVEQVDLADRQVVGGPPVGVDAAPAPLVARGHTDAPDRAGDRSRPPARAPPARAPGSRVAAMSRSPRAGPFASRSIFTPSGARRKAAAARTRAEPSPTPPVKASGVEAPEHGRHPGHRRGQAAVVDGQGQGRVRVVPRARGLHLPHVGDPAVRPLRPLSWFSARSTSARRDAPPQHQVQRDSGSSEPLRVAITRPSRGPKPIVVSADRPPRTAVADAPPPRWHTTRRSSSAAGPAAPPARSRLHADRQAVEAVAADAPLLPPAPRDRVGRRLRRQVGVERRVEHGHLGHGRERGHGRADRRQGGGVVEGRQVGHRLQAAERPRRRGAMGATNSAPPWTTRWPTARRSARRGGRRLDGGAALVVVHEAQLHPRRPGVDDEDASHGDEVSRAPPGSRRSAPISPSSSARGC